MAKISVDLRALPRALDNGWHLVETLPDGRFAVERKASPMQRDPNLYRDGVLGWIGAAVIGGLVWALFAGGPSDREQAARLAVADTVERVEIRAANERLYERGQ